MCFSDKTSKNKTVVIKDAFNVTEKMLSIHESIVGKNVLEIGCGDGYMTEMLQKYTQSIIGIDPCASAIEDARKAVADAEFFVQSGEALSFTDNMFDTVLFSLSLHHHDDPSAAFREAKRVVCPEGMIVVIEPANNSELMKVCAPFDLEERDRLQRADDVLNKYTYKEKHILYPVWRFADVTKLHAWLAEYFVETASSKSHEQADAIIAYKRNETPLDINYELRVMVFNG
ncbi:hypothetical protein SYNTR_0019 [Candidatus Syntrophocurvum alkaliphilum]|uniref:Methyltransferase type 11 domain-containing protein n=1 Tax=Candidatus Syntrophocurvum alkaliphilum TaxID=2293317 RepID=A0A6I6DCJ1_9FIRM|nr:class I SAM-dependent methyltransferase [Candidatus Syntrophocurvum alkaliphilum]QGT98612.1 hypothetical protein SYNTR_0019 [Candidatus Syntrophocurvum alkaliphilum]